jgi:hypothetical protein
MLNLVVRQGTIRLYKVNTDAMFILWRSEHACNGESAAWLTQCHDIDQGGWRRQQEASLADRCMPCEADGDDNKQLWLHGVGQRGWMRQAGLTAWWAREAEGDKQVWLHDRPERLRKQQEALMAAWCIQYEAEGDNKKQCLTYASEGEGGSKRQLWLLKIG